MNTGEAPVDEIDLRPYVAQIWRYKFVAVGCAFVGAAIVMGMTYRQAAVYRAYATVLLPLTASASSPLLGGGATPLSFLEGILRSDASMDKVAITTETKLKDVQKTLVFQPDTNANQMVISATSNDKNKAMALVEATIGTLGELNVTISKNFGQQQARNLNDVIAARGKELQVAEQNLLAFQKASKTAPSTDLSNPTNSAIQQRLLDTQFALEETTKLLDAARGTVSNLPKGKNVPITIPATQKWRDKLVEQEYELSKALIRYNEGAPEVKRLRSEVELTKQTLNREISNYVRSIESGVDDKTADLRAKQITLSWQKDYLSELKKVAPDEALELQRLAARVQTLRETLAALRTEYERARVSESTSGALYTVLVPPRVESEPINKSYSKAGVTGFIAGTFAGIVLSALMAIGTVNRKSKR